MCESGVFGYLIPRVPDWPCPELCYHRLVSRSRLTGVLTQTLYLVQCLDVRLAGHGGRRFWTELRRVVQRKGSYVSPVGETGDANFGGVSW